MRRNTNLLLLMTAILFLTGCDGIMDSQADAGSSDSDPVQITGTPISGQYIVVLNEPSNGTVRGKTTAKLAVESILSENDINLGSLQNTYSAVMTGFSAKLSDSELEKLKGDNRVKYIEQDRVFTLGKPSWAGGGGSNTSGQVTPYGITRVGGSGTSSNTAWVIDTGVDLDHPDLNVDLNRSVSFISNGPDSKDGNDMNGHGTHVAGTIAAIDNDRDVIGVAAGATVVAVKVLDRRGSGSYSGVIAGVDYVANNASSGDVANMSLGGPASQALDDAILAASSVVKFALAAGNDASNANNYSPARVNGPNIYTISAMDENDEFAYFSNFGNPPVDFCAPGVAIESLWKDGGTNTISGTSMATPHVAGLLLLGAISTDGNVIGDLDSNPDPIAHR